LLVISDSGSSRDPCRGIGGWDPTRSERERWDDTLNVVDAIGAS
jgi:hypothetical protein